MCHCIASISREFNLRIFISYTTRDKIITKSLLKTIARYVSCIGSPFVDIIHNNSADKQARVENELLNADILLLLETESINLSPWVTWEINSAIERGIPIVPVKINDTPPKKYEIRKNVKNTIY
ncbi:MULTISPECIES: TIR domain-containing protein [Aeromonas]|uniref:TIR domain-containing protein n=1 Tax=Aeromonas TaxID=642 RepID=UPI0034285DFD